MNERKSLNHFYKTDKLSEKFKNLVAGLTTRKRLHAQFFQNPQSCLNQNKVGSSQVSVSPMKLNCVTLDITQERSIINLALKPKIKIWSCFTLFHLKHDVYLQSPLILFSNEVDGYSLTTKSSTSSDPVNVVFPKTCTMFTFSTQKHKSCLFVGRS